MSKYLMIAVFALAALCAGLWLKHDRDRLVDQLNATTVEIATLRASAQQASQNLQARDELDKKLFQEMANAKNENDRLRADVVAGTKRVLVRANCPKSVPAVSGATRLDDAGATELAADARQDYLRIRDQIITTESQLAGLQAYVHQVVQVVK